ncbi:MAG: hypothetical protein IGS49_27245 [Chlorogloeopsis fritschii C42_A2020_084]|jgi:hypothetical protein|uniref:hypothetical protein n=1 Tax=Chlorogloeopsis fritschii TaxID=1124 RepID=UPI0019F2AC70|nr:hypothetical protein [Chlorogloeopsis fritschii]MBF2009043.1 hypothetical protein [Chlorogloeopsis fritschii C42_A2020_084]
MLRNTNELLVDNSEHKNKSLVQKYLQNPFSIAWSRLAALIKPAPSMQPEDDPAEEYRADYIREQYLYRPFTDRIDPSLYYTIFSPHQRF